MNRMSVIRLYLVCVMAVLSFVSYQAFTTPLPTRTPDAQEILYSKVPPVKAGPPPKASRVEEGEPLAYMTIPRFGEDWLWTTLEGTTMDIINQGPGHFTHSALPGRRGNVAYAAHRATHGDPFIDFDLLVPGDKITLAQPGGSWTYEVTMSPVIIEPGDDWVVQDMQYGRWLTLVTCWPKYGSEKRMYVRAKMVDFSP